MTVRTKAMPFSAPSKPRWSWPHYLALAAIPILIWNGWTVVAWLLDNPHQVTEFRTPGSANWIAAHVLEALFGVMGVAVLVYVIRGCIRAREITFDALFCLAAATLSWADLGVNFFQPTYLASSNFVNLNNMCGHMPLVVNPDCGRAPDPILINWLLGTFGFLAIAIGAERLIVRVRNRWPAVSTLRLIFFLLGVGLLIDLILEPVSIALGLWTYASPSALSLGLGNGYRYAFPEAIAAPLVFALPAAIRIFRDDRGLTFVERGTHHLSPGKRRVVTFLALYTALQFICWIPGSVPIMMYGPYETPWPKLPAHLVNDVCDAPGIAGTRYGACPGAPDYRMPGRHSLPGKSP